MTIIFVVFWLGFDCIQSLITYSTNDVLICPSNWKIMNLKLPLITGSFLVMVMKMVSLGFDVDTRTDRHGEKRPPSVPRVPNFVEYTSYCVFPSTTVFGPFLTFNEYRKFLHPSPLVQFISP